MSEVWAHSKLTVVLLTDSGADWQWCYWLKVVLLTDSGAIILVKDLTVWLATQQQLQKSWTTTNYTIYLITHWQLFNIRKFDPLRYTGSNVNRSCCKFTSYTALQLLTGNMLRLVTKLFRHASGVKYLTQVDNLSLQSTKQATVGSNTFYCHWNSWNDQQKICKVCNKSFSKWWGRKPKVQTVYFTKG